MKKIASALIRVALWLSPNLVIVANVGIDASGDGPILSFNDADIGVLVNVNIKGRRNSRSPALQFTTVAPAPTMKG